MGSQAICMNGPPELVTAILKIIETGVLRARSLAWSGQAGRSVIEADHIHNLPR
jgi:hypothetical protein